MINLFSSNTPLVRFQRFLASLSYPLQRFFLERKYSRFNTIATIKPQGKILGFEDNSKKEDSDRSLKFYFSLFELNLEFLADNLVRIDWHPKITNSEVELLPPLPYGIARKNWAAVETTITETENGYCISTPALKVIVSEDGHITYKNAQGQTLRQDLPPELNIKQSQGTEIATWRHQGEMRPDEHIYGLGERAAPLNLRRLPEKRNSSKPPYASYRMWNKDAQGTYGSGDDPLYICIPFYLGLHSEGSYGLFYENPFPATLSFNNLAIADFEGGALRYYFIAGSPQEVLDRYTELTGKPALPPRWALGYHQSRWGYEKETALRQTVKNLETYEIPVSALHLDIDCLDKFKAFTIDPDRFPTLSELAGELTPKGIHLVTILNPGIKADRQNQPFQEGKTLDFFCKLSNGEIATGSVWPGKCAFPDFTHPQARHWWSRQYQYLLDIGITGFWHDMNEPALLVLWGDPSFGPFSTRHYLEGRGGDHREAHNVYGFLQTQAGYQALRQYQPQKRPFIVSRCGWAGLQRYAWTWTGDIEGTWSALRQTLPMILNLGLTAIPYSGPDIGGFRGNPPSELYLRWFQLSSFLPFCRTHSDNASKARAPWTFGEPTLTITRDFLNLRYKLMPYFYTLAYVAHQKGYPLVRPLFWGDVTNTKLWDIDDSFMLGDALLVAPVFQEKTFSRSVTLPSGHWYNFWDDTTIAGDQTLTLESPLERIPLLVKAGHILPQEANVELIINIYPTPEGFCEGQVYTDAGDGFEEGRLDRFQLSSHHQGWQLVKHSEGDYPLPYKGFRLCFHGLKITEAWKGDQSIPLEDNSFFVEEFDQIYLKS